MVFDVRAMPIQRDVERILGLTEMLRVHSIINDITSPALGSSTYVKCVACGGALYCSPD